MGKCCDCITLKGRVYLDSNSNNQYDEGEGGVFTLLLTYPDESTQTFQTKSDGSYKKGFKLKNGDYTLTVVEYPSFSNTFTKNKCSSCVSYDFAIQTVIEGFFFLKNEDTANYNSSIDIPVVGGLANLLTSTNSVISSVTTDSNGKYKFFVTPGSYRVSFAAGSLTNVGIIKGNQGSDDTDSDNDVSNRTNTKWCGFYRVPDFTISSFLDNLTPNGVSTLNFIITISELNGNPLFINNRISSNLIVSVPNSSNITMNWNPSLGSLLSNSVNNVDWQYLGIISNTHRWRYIGNSGVFIANGVSKIGVSLVWDNLGASGIGSFSWSVGQGSGGESNFLNNSSVNSFTYT